MGCCYFYFPDITDMYSNPVQAAEPLEGPFYFLHCALISIDCGVEKPVDFVCLGFGALLLGLGKLRCRSFRGLQ